LPYRAAIFNSKFVYKTSLKHWIATAENFSSP